MGSVSGPRSLSCIRPPSLFLQYRQAISSTDIIISQLDIVNNSFCPSGKNPRFPPPRAGIPAVRPARPPYSGASGAVRFRALSPVSPRQAGRHREAGPDCKVPCKGVVFSEMKRTFCSSRSCRGVRRIAISSPDTCRFRVSGDEPGHIPEPTREQFATAYRTWYHPSCVLIFLGGAPDAALQILGKSTWRSLTPGPDACRNAERNRTPSSL